VPSESVPLLSHVEEDFVICSCDYNGHYDCGFTFYTSDLLAGIFLFKAD
jgi:hypothetical protein